MICVAHWTTSTTVADGNVRLDAAIAARGLSRSRSTAQQAVRAGRVRINGAVVRKPATGVRDVDRIDVEAGPGEQFVSRGAVKLGGALDSLDVPVRGLRCIDVGASTGGFSQVLLQRGALQVTAIDVGTDQLAQELRDDPRVHSLEGTHVGRDDLSSVAPADLVVVDLSFISLSNVMSALSRLVVEDGILLPMVKPQFEVGRARLGKGGVVTDGDSHRDAVAQTVVAAAEHEFVAVAVATSPLPGPAGNLEFFVRLERGVPAVTFDVLWAARETSVEH